jgi:hypothetical protein
MARAARAMTMARKRAMARKTAIGSNVDENHDDNEDSDNDDNHNDKDVEDDNNDDDTDDDDKDNKDDGGNEDDGNLGCLFLFDRNLFSGLKNRKKSGFLRISFFSCVFLRIFSQERGFGGGCSRNSCIYSGFLRIPPDSCSRQTLSCSGQRLK